MRLRRLARGADLQGGRSRQLVVPLPRGADPAAFLVDVPARAGPADWRSTRVDLTGRCSICAVACRPWFGAVVADVLAPARVAPPSRRAARRSPTATPSRGSNDVELTGDELDATSDRRSASPATSIGPPRRRHGPSSPACDPAQLVRRRRGRGQSTTPTCDAGAARGRASSAVDQARRRCRRRRHRAEHRSRRGAPTRRPRREPRGDRARHRQRHRGEPMLEANAASAARSPVGGRRASSTTTPPARRQLVDDAELPTVGDGRLAGPASDELDAAPVPTRSSWPHSVDVTEPRPIADVDVDPRCRTASTCRDGRRVVESARWASRRRRRHAE